MRYFHAILIFLSFCYVSIGQNPLWVNCLSQEQVNDYAETETHTWYATLGGLVSEDKATGERKFYNCANSDLTTNGHGQIIVDEEDTVWFINNGLTSIESGNWVLHPEISGRLTLDESGKILVANGHGIHTWDGTGFDTIPFPDQFPEFYEVNDVIVDEKNGDVWISRSTFGAFDIVHYGNQEWSIYDSSNSALPWESPSNNQFSFDAQNRLWISGSAVSRFDSGEWKDVSELLGIENEWQICISHDKAGNTYVITSNTQKQIIKVSSDDMLSEVTLPDWNEDTIYPVFIDVSEDASSIKVSTPKFGFWELSDGDWNKIKTSENKLLNNHFEIAQENSGKIYLSNGHGRPYSFSQIFSFADAEWTDLTHTYPFSLLPETKSGIDVDFYSNSSLSYMHFLDQLYSKSGNGWEPLDFPDVEVEVEEANSEIFIDQFSNTWLLNKWNDHLLLNQDGSWLFFEKDEHGAAPVNAFYFNHPSTGHLWITSEAGISIYNYATKTWQIINLKDHGLFHKGANIDMDSNGILWGHNSREFFRMTDVDDIEILYDLWDGASVFGRFRCMLVEDDQVWLGLDEGMLLFQNDEFTRYNSLNSGLSNGLVNGFARDMNNNLWISSHSGLSIYNPNGVTDDLIAKTGLSKTADPTKGGFKLYPNPTSGEFVLELEKNGNHALSIYTMEGRRVFTLGEVKDHQLVEALLDGEGIYLIMLEDLENGMVYTQKLILTR